MNKKQESHGHATRTTKTRTYTIWAGMKERCLNPKYHAYKYYGGRGIQVCEEWQQSFLAFIRDMGEAPEGLSLDRYPNNDGNYELGNCRWATRNEQRRNARHARIIEFNGEKMCVTDWEKKLGLKESVIKWRLAHGWSVEKALSPHKFSKYGAR